jgi:hypothetical protein
VNRDESPPDLRRAVAAVLTLGVAWASFLFALSRGGHQPSFVLLPIPPERYYAVEAALVIPTLFALWGLMSGASHAVARALGGSGELRASATAMGMAWALPMLGYIFVDLLLYVTGGFDALGLGARIALPVAGVFALLLAGRALTRVHGLGAGRAYAAALVGLVVQALAGAPVLR